MRGALQPGLERPPRTSSHPLPDPASPDGCSGWLCASVHPALPLPRCSRSALLPAGSPSPPVSPCLPASGSCITPAPKKDPPFSSSSLPLAFSPSPGSRLPSLLFVASRAALCDLRHILCVCCSLVSHSLLHICPSASLAVSLPLLFLPRLSCLPFRLSPLPLPLPSSLCLSHCL